MSIGNRDRPADQAHRTKIINIVAQVGSTIQTDTMLRQPFADHSALVLNTVHDLDTQLGCACLDDGIDLLGHN